MSTKGIIAVSRSKRNPQSQQRNPRPPRRPRPHGKPQPGRYRPPARPPRYALDMGRNVSLLLTLEKNRIAPNALTLTKIGGGE